MQITVTIRNLTTAFNFRPVYWGGWLMLVYLRGGCTGGDLCCSSEGRTPHAGRAGGPTAHQGQVPMSGLASWLEGALSICQSKSSKAAAEQWPGQCFFNCRDDTVRVFSSFKYLPWLFLLLQNENLPRKWQMVYCKKNTPSTAKNSCVWEAGDNRAANRLPRR